MYVVAAAVSFTIWSVANSFLGHNQLYNNNCVRGYKRSIGETRAVQPYPDEALHIQPMHLQNSNVSYYSKVTNTPLPWHRIVSQRRALR